MSTNEAIEILGKPTQIKESDIPGQYWCYETDHFSRILADQPELRCEKLLIETSSDGRIAKVFDF